MNDNLMLPVTDAEIKKGVFDTGALKALGMDELNGLFYQNHWKIIKHDICTAVKDFFVDGSLPAKLNETTIALVPKVSLPESTSQLRPISYCNFLYNIIFKVMVSRLKVFLGELVLPTQSAFVEGTQIQDNLVIAQEVFHSLKRKNIGVRENVVLKIDMNKACDRLD